MSVKKRGHRGKKMGKNARDALKRVDDTSTEEHSQVRIQAAHVLRPEQDHSIAAVQAALAIYVLRLQTQADAQATLTSTAELATAQVKEAPSK
jgi:hypothetical protein